MRGKRGGAGFRMGKKDGQLTAPAGILKEPSKDVRASREKV